MIAVARDLRITRPVTPFVERTVHENGMTYGLSVAGYDVRIRDELFMGPGDFALADTYEEFSMPLNYVGVVHDKSTLARLGIAVQNTVIEPGWRGVLRLEITNHSKNLRRMLAGSPIAQILFHLTTEDTDGYSGRYQDQKPGQDAIWNSHATNTTR